MTIKLEIFESESLNNLKNMVDRFMKQSELKRDQIIDIKFDKGQYYTILITYDGV